MIQAAIDIGTNTMLLLVAEVDPSTHRITRTIDQRIEYPRLGEGVHANRRFSEAAMNRAFDVFQKYKSICTNHGVEKIFAIATSASRDSQNAKSFYEKIEKELGIHVDIILGEKEAKFSFLGGMLPGFNANNTALMDIGGGSTEFVTYDPIKGIPLGQSLDIGCVRATELYLQGDPYTAKSLEELESQLRMMWEKLNPDLQTELRKKEWIGIAGTATTMAAIALDLKSFNSEMVDGYRIERCAIADIFESLAIQSEERRKANPVIGTGRSDVIVAGAAILLTAMEVFEKEEIIVSSRGLRHGVLTHPELLTTRE